MPTTVTKVRIFLASPGDCVSERQQFDNVIDELNRILPALVPDKQLVLELVKWETAVTPGVGRDAQEVVNRQIGDYDIFVGILWKRMGTPTAVAASGTEEEYRRAYDRWETDKKLPILFYFSQEPYLIKTPAEAQQLQNVLAFRDELSKHGLVWDYPEPAKFADVIRPHLALVLGQMFSDRSGQETAHSIQRLSPDLNEDLTRSKVLALAKDYVTLREKMGSSGERTRKMSSIASQLRGLAASAYDLLPDLAISASAGERLAAICILQQVPTPRYLYWLAERVSTEKPFPGYQATVALLLAVRSLGEDSSSDLSTILKRAKEFLAERTYKDPNQKSVLENALSELRARTSD
jgi:hypothetical protein